MYVEYYMQESKPFFRNKGYVPQSADDDILYTTVHELIHGVKIESQEKW